MPNVPLIRIFLSSPGDVNQERKIMLEAIDMLSYLPMFRGKVAIQVIAWDKPGAGTVMRATLTPQEALNKNLPTPAECDLVFVLFWSRMGTSFVLDGEEFLSGTHWELLNALSSDTTETIIYHRTEKQHVAPDDTDGLEQYHRVQDFFKSDIFYGADGVIKRGVNQYKSLDEFRINFNIDLQELILEQLDKYNQPSVDTSTLASDDNVTNIVTQDWQGSPFPGLRSFTEADNPIFFGREREIDALIRQMGNSRLVAVVGASGSGKSSLVHAGLIPALHDNAILGSKDWEMVAFTPSIAPYRVLTEALLDTFDDLRPHPMERRRIIDNFVDSLKVDSSYLIEVCDTVLSNRPDWTEILFIIDQFEELFTLTDKIDVAGFAELLQTVATSDRLRIVLTMRHDFFGCMIENRILSTLLRSDAVFSLSSPGYVALRQMIERPAERAGLQIEAGLIDRILEDTGDEPGNLALLAYALDELYQLSDDLTLMHRHYEQLGQVQGVIGTRAENTFNGLNIDYEVLYQLFLQLVEVDEYGTATRRRQLFQMANLPDELASLINAFTDARLLITNYDETQESATVEVAHEAVLTQWSRLADWVYEQQSNLRLIRNYERDATDWNQRGKPSELQPKHEELLLFKTAVNSLGLDKSQLSPLLQTYTEPEQERILKQITAPHISHRECSNLGERLGLIGDTRQGIGISNKGLPDIDWCAIAHEYEVYDMRHVFEDNYGNEYGAFIIYPFYIAKYPITYQQFQAFLDAEDGFSNDSWWDKLDKRPMENQLFQIDNYPRDSVSWHQAVAFTRWLDFHYRKSGLLPEPPQTIKHLAGDSQQHWGIRLPVEWEWQHSASDGAMFKVYPWGKWNPKACNSIESGLKRSTAVGMYPQGKTKTDVFDLSGNVWEWCLNSYTKNNQERVLRGGSWDSDSISAQSSNRSSFYPFNGYGDVGFRVCVGLHPQYVMTDNSSFISPVPRFIRKLFRR